MHYTFLAEKLRIYLDTWTLDLTTLTESLTKEEEEKKIWEFDILKRSGNEF